MSKDEDHKMEHETKCFITSLRVTLPEPQETPTKDVTMYSEDGCVGTMKLPTWELGE